MSTLLRTNHCLTPRLALGIADAVSYAIAGGETGTTSLVTGATDGPLVPGGRIASYARRHTDTPRASGSPGWQTTPSAQRTPLAGREGEAVTISLHARYSGTEPILPRLRLYFYDAAGQVGTNSDSPSGQIVLAAEHGWVRCHHTATAQGDFTHVSWWLYQTGSADGQTTQAGTDYDITGIMIEPVTA